MAKKKVEREFAEAWKPEAEGESITGIYLGSEIVPAGPKVEKPFTSYHFRTKEGKKVGVSGDALKFAMERVAIGTEVEIVYKGRIASEKKGRNAYKAFDILVDEETALLDPATGLADDDGELV